MEKLSIEESYDSIGTNWEAMQRSTAPESIEKVKQIRGKVDALMPLYLQRYPELRVTDEAIPNEENGYYQIHQIGKTLHGGMSMNTDHEIRGMLRGTHSWDDKRIVLYLETNKALIEELLKIGKLPSQSSLIEGKNTFIVWQTFFYDFDLLLLSCKHKARSGDTEGAIDGLRAARGLIRHFNGARK